MNLRRFRFVVKGRVKQMNKYKIVLYGVNFLLNLKGGEQRIDFFATYLIEAEHPLDAEESALIKLKRDSGLDAIIINEPEDPPSVLIEEIEELDEIDDHVHPSIPFVFLAHEHNRGDQRRSQMDRNRYIEWW